MRLLLILWIVFASLSLTASTNTFSFDLSRDFSLAGNPNGAWRYGRQDVIGGTFSIFAASSTVTADNGVPVLLWAFAASSQPAIYHNDTTETATSGGGSIFPPETTWFAPGVQGQPGDYAVARLTVPVARAGTYRLVARALPVFESSAQLDTDFHIVRNNEEVFGVALSGGQTTAYTNTMVLVTGDTIDFAVGRGADNDYVGSVLKVEATLELVSTNPAPPGIYVQPRSQTVAAGASVTFSVSAEGDAPLSYQWWKGATAINGATASTMTLSNVQVALTGGYSVVVSNAYGVATSQTATLTVNPPADHDLSRDFSLSSNPNGVWSYGRQETVGGAFTLLGTAKTNFANVPMILWAISASSQPAILHNDTTETVIITQGEYPPETTWFAPGIAGQPGNYGVARVTVPVGGDGTYQLVTRARPGFDVAVQLDTDFHVAWNNVEIFGAQLSGTQTAGYTNTLALAAGDTIDFLVGRGADNSHVWSQLKVEAILDRLSTNPVPPTILVQPASQNVTAGTTVGFTVSVNGSSPLSYQWWKGPTAVNGATASSLTLSNVQVAQSGEYSVVVSNEYGVATSQAATLTVNPAPDYDLSRDFSLSSNPIGAWSYGRQEVVGGAFTLLGTSKTSPADNGVPIMVWAINAVSQPAIFHNDTTETATSSGGAVLPPETTWFAPGLQGQPGNYAVARLTVPFGRAGTYRLVATALPTFEESVQSDTVFHIARNNAQVFGAALSGSETAAYTNTIVLVSGDTIDFAVGRGANSSQAWSVLKVEAALYLVSTTPAPPGIYGQPQSQTVTAGASATFSVSAEGALPLGYRWRKGLTPIGSGTNASLTLTNVQLSDAGIYSVVVSNAQGTATSSNATLTVIGASGPTLVVPRTAENTHTPYGSGALRDAAHYQQVYGSAEFPPQAIWIHELRFRPDATYGSAFTTTVANIQFNLSTSTRNPGALSSSFANNIGTNDTVVFQGALSISSQFVGPAAGPKAFDIIVPLSQAFLFDPQRGNLVVDIRNFSGSGATLTGGQSGPDAAGRVFSANVASTSGGVDSGADAIQIVYSPATNLPPVISTQPAHQAALEGGSVTFTVSASGTAPFGYYWQRNNTPISGPHSATLTLTNLQLAQAGNYSVVVSNAFGLAMSQAATLTVYALPEYAAVVPRTAENTETPFGSGTLREAGVRDQQVYGSVEFPQLPMVIEELRFRPEARFGGAFRTSVSNIQINLSTTQRNPGLLSPTFSQNVGADDTIVFQGQLDISSQFVGLANGPKAFDIVVPLAQPFFYDPAGGNLVIDIRNFSGSTASVLGGQTGPDSAGRVLGAVGALSGTVDSGADAIQVVFSPATNLAPRIVMQPRNQGVLPGSNVTFTVAAVGTAPLTYQWTFNGVPIPGAIGVSLTITNVETSDAGFYAVAVENNFGGTVSSIAALSIVTQSALVIPAGLQSREGAAGSGTLTEQVRVQEVYGGLQFPAGNLYITELRFRPSVDFSTGAFTTAVDNIQINLSTTARQPNNLSLTFAENTGTNDTIVFSGELLLSSQFTGPVGGPKNFDIIVPLQTPFVYNRAQGNLLIDVRNFTGAALRYVHDIDSAVDQASRIIATTATATQAVTADHGADVVQIIYSTTNTAARLVSIPSSLPGTFAFTFQAAGSGSYVVEASSNLVNWAVVTNVVDASGLVEIVHPQVLPRRFYRARTP